MKKLLFICIVAMAFAASSCNHSVLVYKNGRGVFLTSNSKSKYDVLCASGDLKKILAISDLSEEMKDELYTSNCSAERSSEKVRQIYASMTPEERKEIKRAFRKVGYMINIMAA